MVGIVLWLHYVSLDAVGGRAHPDYQEGMRYLIQFDVGSKLSLRDLF